MEIGNRNKKGTKVTRFLGEGRGRGGDRPFCFAALSKRRGIRGLPRNSGGNMDRVNRLLFFFLFFIIFFSFLERQRRGRNIGRPSFENKIEQNRGFEKDMKWKEESFLRLMKSGTRIFLGKIISYILSYLFLIL